MTDDPRIHVDLAHLAGLEARAAGFDFLPRQPVGSVLSGRRAARVRGRGLEFEEIRGYLPGDDVRAIDWKVTARTGSPHVRVTREERDRPALIVADQRNVDVLRHRAQHEVGDRRRDRRDGGLAHPRRRRPGGGHRALRRWLRRCRRPAEPWRGAAVARGSLGDRNGALSAEAPVAPGAAARLNAALARPAEIVTHDWLLLVVSDFDGADDETFRILAGIARGNDLVLALVHDPSAHETPASGRIVVGDGRLQVELDLADARVRRNLAGVGGERIARLLAWQERLDAAILPVSASEPTGPQLLRLFGAPPRRRV